MFTAPEAAAANVATAGAESITGAPVQQMVGTGQSLASLDRALAENPQATNRDELLALRDHLSERAESRSRRQPSDHIPNRAYDRRVPHDPAPHGLVVVRDENGTVVSYQGLDGYRGLPMQPDLPGPFDWHSRSRDAWRFTMPRRYQLGRHVRPSTRKRMVPMENGRANMNPMDLQSKIMRPSEAPASQHYDRR